MSNPKASLQNEYEISCYRVDSQLIFNSIIRKFWEFLWITFIADDELL